MSSRRHRSRKGGASLKFPTASVLCGSFRQQRGGAIADGNPVERRLAAMVAADVVGYSRLMGADEVGTIRALRTHRRELIDRAIAAHRGRIVKTTGACWLVPCSPRSPPLAPPTPAPVARHRSPASQLSGRRRRPLKGSPPSAAQTERAVSPHSAFMNGCARSEEKESVRQG